MTDVANVRWAQLELLETVDRVAQRVASQEPSGATAGRDSAGRGSVNQVDRATLRRGGKSALVDGLVLFTEGGACAPAFLQRVIALLNGTDSDACDSAAGQTALIVSAGGGRIDHPTLGVSVRVRGEPARGRALIAEIAQRWNSGATEVCEPRGAPSEATTCDALRLHRYHLRPSGSKVVLDHGELQLHAQVSPPGTDEARAFAWRIAQAWNMAQGWSASAAQAGALCDLDGAVAQLVAAFEQGRDYHALVAEIAKLLPRRDSMMDLSHGRAHDCEQCLAASGTADGGEDEPEVGASCA